jgi:hypothetical protein
MTIAHTWYMCRVPKFPIPPDRKDIQLDKQLENIYQSPEAQALERQLSSRDKRRTRLLKAFTRTADVLASPHPLAILAPMRRHRLDVLTFKLERNRIKHRHRAVKTLLRQYLKTPLKEVYALFKIEYRPGRGTD